MQELTDKFTETSKLLVGLNAQIDREAYRPDLSRIHEKSARAIQEPSRLTWFLCSKRRYYNNCTICLINPKNFGDTHA